MGFGSKVLSKYDGNKRKKFTLDKVMSYVLELESESKMSELEDYEDEDYVPYVADRLEEDAERELNVDFSDDNEGWGELKTIIFLNILQMLTAMMQMTRATKNYRIRMRSTSAGGKRKSLLFLVPHLKEMKPLQYFELFWDENILEDIAHHKKLYSVQKSGNSIKTNAK